MTADLNDSERAELWHAYTRWEEGVDFGEHMGAAVERILAARLARADQIAAKAIAAEQGAWSQAWDDAHAEVCQRSHFCSAHKPGVWPHLFHDALARTTAPGVEGSDALRAAAEWVVGCEHIKSLDWCSVCDQWREALLDRADSLDPRVRGRAVGEGEGTS